MIILKSLSGQVESSVTIADEANLTVVVDVFADFLRVAGYVCTRESIKEALSEEAE